MITFYVPTDEAAAHAATILADAAMYDPNFADTDFQLHVNPSARYAYAEGPDSDDVTVRGIVNRMNGDEDPSD